MDSTETSANHRAIDDLLELIAERVPAERRDAIEAFAKAYTRRLTEEEFRRDRRHRTLRHGAVDLRVRG